MMPTIRRPDPAIVREKLVHISRDIATTDHFHLLGRGCRKTLSVLENINIAAYNGVLHPMCRFGIGDYSGAPDLISPYPTRR